jgi:hypothetical protein
MSGGLKLMIPGFMYPLFKRFFWKHVNGAIWDPPGSFWVRVDVIWRCNT